MRNNKRHPAGLLFKGAWYGYGEPPTRKRQSALFRLEKEWKAL